MQRIFWFINKRAVSIKYELFQNCLNRLEINGSIKKKSGKNASFFVHPIVLDSNKIDGLDNVQRVDKSESPKTFEKLESIADRDLKGALEGLRQFLATETPLKMMKNPFYFTSKALFVLKIFKFFSWILVM